MQTRSGSVGPVDILGNIDHQFDTEEATLFLNHITLIVKRSPKNEPFYKKKHTRVTKDFGHVRCNAIHNFMIKLTSSFASIALSWLLNMQTRLAELFS
jgi:hypothetical protein